MIKLGPRQRAPTTSRLKLRPLFTKGSFVPTQVTLECKDFVPKGKVSTLDRLLSDWLRSEFQINRSTEVPYYQWPWVCGKERLEYVKRCYKYAIIVLYYIAARWGKVLERDFNLKVSIILGGIPRWVLIRKRSYCTRKTEKRWVGLVDPYTVALSLTRTVEEANASLKISYYIILKPTFLAQKEGRLPGAGKEGLPIAILDEGIKIGKELVVGVPPHSIMSYFKDAIEYLKERLKDEINKIAREYEIEPEIEGERLLEIIKRFYQILFEVMKKEGGEIEDIYRRIIRSKLSPKKKEETIEIYEPKIPKPAPEEKKEIREIISWKALYRRVEREIEILEKFEETLPGPERKKLKILYLILELTEEYRDNPEVLERLQKLLEDLKRGRSPYEVELEILDLRYD